MNKFLLALSVAAVMTGTANAVPGTMQFTYNTGNKEIKHYGYGKAETYDVAIKIQDPIYTGTAITGFSVELPVVADDVENLSGWLSKELTIENKVNVPDIESAGADFSNGLLSVSFATPYTIPAEGVYVGYSFKIKNVKGDADPKNPVAVVEGRNENGLYLHSSRTRLKWSSISESTGFVSAMVVNIKTDFGSTDAVISLPEKIYVERGKDFKLAATVVNHGAEPLTKIGYSYTAGEYTGSGEYTFASPIEKLGDSATAELEVKGVPSTGNYDFSVTIDKFNGQVNNDPFRTAGSTLVVMPFVPVTRPLVEEFTGLGCGYCPRGYVAMEELNEALGDMFVGMAFHGSAYESGCMVTVRDSDMPFSVSGYPYGDIDRRTGMDPSYFPEQWPVFQNRIAPADIDVTLNWTDDSKQELEALATVRFVESYDNANFKLAIALVADGLMNEEWGQSNYYSGLECPDTDLWNLFAKGDSKVYGLVFNDVVAYFKETRGIEGSIPAAIASGENIEYSYKIKKEDVKNVRGQDFINDGATVHAVAILLDGETGYSLNCNKSKDIPFGDSAGVDTVEVENDAVIAYYDLNGRRVMNPEKGLFIARTASGKVLKVVK